jgi:hypothetical protein
MFGPTPCAPAESLSPVAQDSGFLLKHFLDAVLGDEDMGDWPVEFRRGGRARKSINHLELKGVSGFRFNSLLDAMHCQLEQLGIEGIFEPLSQDDACVRPCGDQVDQGGDRAWILATCRDGIAQGVWVTVLSHAWKDASEQERRRLPT